MTAATEHPNTNLETHPKATAPIWAARKKRRLTELFGGGKDAEEAASSLTAVEYDLPIPEPTNPAHPAKSD